MTLERRLLLLIAVVAPLVWLVAAGIAWTRTEHELDELYDTELVRLARQVMTLLPPSEPAPEALRATPAQTGAGPGGEADLRTLSVTVWHGRTRILSDTEGVAMPWREGDGGFVDLAIDGRPWRAYYLRESGDGPRTVAVGRDLHERDELAQGLLGAQLLPWLLMLPVLLVVLALAVRRAFSPLRRVSTDVARRDAADLRPIGAQGLPSDLRPLVASIDGLLARLDTAFRQERRFTADAAHELRTPIAALRAQWDALRLSRDPAERERAAAGVSAGLERLSHLVAQMLALARADAGAALAAGPVDWRAVVEQAVSDTLPLADAREARLEVDWPEGGSVDPMPVAGDATLLASMLRNLLDNAVRYGPVGGRVRVRMLPDSIVVEDKGPGLAPEVREHLGERFRRPAGSAQSGSGLGVSIAAGVARVHGLTLRFEERDDGPGLRVTVSRRAA